MSKLIHSLTRLCVAVLVVLISSSAAGAQADPIINRSLFGQVAGDGTRILGVTGDPHTDYSTFSLLVIEGEGMAAGYVDEVLPVGVTDEHGSWTVAILPGVLESSTMTLLLVEGFSGFFGDDLDSNDDGVFDNLLWTRVVDSMAITDRSEFGITYASRAQTFDRDAGIASSLGASGAAGENFLINGDFQVWQRGTSFTTPGYWADRFRGEIGGGATITRQEFAQGQTAVPWAPKAYLRHDRTAAAPSANTVLEQRVNSVDPHLGATVTVSVWLRAGAAKTFAIDFLQHFGRGGSPDVSVASQPISVSTSWSKFALTFTLPSTSGKTTGEDDYLSVRIREEAQFSVFRLDIALFKLERGSTATEFVRKKNQQIIDECLYYYQRIDASGNILFNFATGSIQTANSFEALLFYTWKRRFPTISFSGRFEALVGGTAFAISNPTVLATTGPGNTLSNIKGSVSVPGFILGKAGAWRAAHDAAAFIEIDAEL